MFSAFLQLVFHTVPLFFFVSTLSSFIGILFWPYLLFLYILMLSMLLKGKTSGRKAAERTETARNGKA
jgi:hypothetical protein